MSESLMGGYPDSPTWSQRALDDLQDRIDTTRAEEGDSASESVLADLWYRIHEKEPESAAIPGETTEVVSSYYRLGSEGTQGSTSHSTAQNELDRLNGRVVRRGEQSGEANF